MQSFSVITAVATAGQRPSVSELHVVKEKHGKKGSATEVKAHASPVTAVEQHLHTQRSVPQEMQNATSAGRKDILRVAADQRRRKRR